MVCVSVVLFIAGYIQDQSNIIVVLSFEIKVGKREEVVD